MRIAFDRTSFACIIAVWIGLLGSGSRCSHAAEPERLPVVFVPGTAGSQLSSREADGSTKPLWLSMRLIDPSPGGIDLAALGTDDSSRAPLDTGLRRRRREYLRARERSGTEVLSRRP